MKLTTQQEQDLAEKVFRESRIDNEDIRDVLEEEDPVKRYRAIVGVASIYFGMGVDACLEAIKEMEEDEVNEQEAE